MSVKLPDKILNPNKRYPEDYPEDALNVLNAMSFTNGKDVLLLGSMALRAVLYAGDFDAFEVVKARGSPKEVLHDLAKKFQQIIKKLESIEDVTIGDIKAGTIEDWRVIPRNAGLVDGKLINWNAHESKKKLKELYDHKIVSKDEYENCLKLLVDHPNHEQFFKAKKECRFNIVRWTPAEVRKNKKILRNGQTMTLEQAFNTPTIAKLDIVGFVQNNRYTDFSMIYEFWAGDTPLNPDKIEITKSLKEDIVYYTLHNNPFKVIKRIFALAKYKHNDKVVDLIIPILNSDLGRLYSISSDLGTLISLTEEGSIHSIKKVKFEIDQMRSRIGNIFQLNDFANIETHFLALLASLENSNKKNMKSLLEKLKEIIDKELNKHSDPILKKLIVHAK